MEAENREGGKEWLEGRREGVMERGRNGRKERRKEGTKGGSRETGRRGRSKLEVE